MPLSIPVRNRWLARPPTVLCYAAAVLLAVAAQLARLPLNPPTLTPNITYVPFLVLSAAYGGFGPGLLTTLLCFAECIFFATQPTWSFAVRDPYRWEGLIALLLTGLVISLLFGREKRARRRDSIARELAALLNETYDAVFVWDLESKQITFWDNGALRLYGRSSAEALGHSVQELLASRFPQGLAACLSELRQSAHWEGELDHTTRDGRRITVECRMASRQGDDGRTHVMEVARDISERKRLEQIKAQLAHEQKLQKNTMEVIIQSSPACVALLRGPDFTFEAVNPAYQELLPGERVVGRTVAEVWPEAAPLVVPLLTVVREAQTPYHATETRIPRGRTPGGPVEDRYFDFSYVPLVSPDGEVQILVSAIEVTRYKKIEQELRVANHELTTIYGSTPVALMLLDHHLRVRKLNDMAVRFAGADSSQAVGQQFGGVVGCLDSLENPVGCGHGESCIQCPVRLAVLDTLQNGIRHDNVESWLPLSIDGRTERRCLSVSTAFMQPNGERKVLVCAYDITPSKISEETLRKTVQELKSALTQRTVLLKEVHHRVKNNLAVIASLLSMKADDAVLPEVRLALEESRGRVLSISLIHEQLYGSEQLDRINFLEYASQFVEQLHSFYVSEPQRILIRLDIAPIEMGVHRAVPCALILNELVSNAFKHAFPGGRSGEVRISLQDSVPGLLELAVEDNGIGSPPGVAARPTKSLGLKIVAILSRQLDGSFEQQATEGGGSRFVLRFAPGTSRRAA